MPTKPPHPVLFWDVTNWQAACKPCHDAKTPTETGWGGARGGRPVKSLQRCGGTKRGATCTWPQVSLGGGSRWLASVGQLQRSKRLGPDSSGGPHHAVAGFLDLQVDAKPRAIEG